VAGASDLPLAETVSLVTGASSGIGHATALALAAEGSAVALVARRRDRLQQVAEAITEHGGAVLIITADLTAPDQAAEAVERAVGQFGRLDIVVNNAGVMYSGPITSTTREQWERMIATNVGGVLNVTRTALPHLVTAAEQGPRRVADLVNISSTLGRVARPGASVYSMTKFGINGLSESMRQELLAMRVRVSVIEPGKVETEMTVRARAEHKEGVGEMIQTIERLRPGDIAEAIVFIVTRDRRVAINEILIRPSEQTS
jgi:NADP-dependent 3-hydroxy acid dehydrogenase YdfG